MTMKECLKTALFQSGYQVRRVNSKQIGHDPFLDMRRLTNSEKPMVLFDVGANRGQSIFEFHKHFPSSAIYAFEPSPSTFEHLKEKTNGISNLHLTNAALGAKCEIKTLIEHSQDTVTSFLQPGKDFQWVTKSNRVDVEVRSIDSYCDAAGIDHINVLKSDTQGFDYEVLKGGLDLLRRHRVQLVYLELNFLNLYDEMPRFEDIYLFLKGLGFQLVSFYNFTWQDSRLGWLDGLFIDPLFTDS